VQLRGETVDRVKAVELEAGDDRFVTLSFGDNRSGPRLIGDAFTIRRLMARATLKLIALPHSGDDIGGW
jgi:hypothetical protein